jgi:hypothetical protein
LIVDMLQQERGGSLAHLYTLADKLFALQSNEATCDVSDATAFLNAAPSVAISLSKART